VPIRYWPLSVPAWTKRRRAARRKLAISPPDKQAAPRREGLLAVRHAETTA
jgi:hypothetical protein